MTRRRKLRTWASALGAVLVACFIVAASTTWLRDGLMPPLIESDQLRSSDVIIILGAGTRNHGDRLGPQPKQRVLEGIKLFQQGWAPNVIISGGRDKNTGYIESLEMMSYAITKGLPATVITPEEQSKDTWQNAADSLVIMHDHGWKTALVVTSPYHTWRACHIFRKQNIDVRCISAPFSLLPVNTLYEHLTDTRSVVREYAAIVYNWLKGEL